MVSNAHVVHLRDAPHKAYLQGITPMTCDKVLNCFPHAALTTTRALEKDRNHERERNERGRQK